MCRPSAMSADRPAASDGGPVVSHTRHPVDDRVLPTLHVCFLTGAPRRRRPGRCPPFHAPIPPATSTDCPAVWLPSPSSGGRWLLCFPSRDPPYPAPGRFGRATAGYVDCPQAAMGSRHRPETAQGQSGDRSPSCPRWRSNSDHAGKSTYLGKIESLDRDPGIATLVPGMRFPGN